MWKHGFKLKMKEIIEAFAEDCKVSIKSKEFKIVEKNDLVTIYFLGGDDIILMERTFSFDDLYSILVPNDEIYYLLLMEDVLFELAQEDRKELVVKQYLNNLLNPMAKTLSNLFWGESEVEEIDNISYYFTQNGVKFGQLSLI